MGANSSGCGGACPTRKGRWETPGDRMFVSARNLLPAPCGWDSRLHTEPVINGSGFLKHTRRRSLPDQRTRGAAPLGVLKQALSKLLVSRFRQQLISPRRFGSPMATPDRQILLAQASAAGKPIPLDSGGRKWNDDPWPAHVCQSSSAVEQRTHKPLVAGSIPASGTTIFDQ